MQGKSQRRQAEKAEKPLSGQGGLRFVYVTSAFWPKADISLCTAHVCFRGKADMIIDTRELFLGAQAHVAALSLLLTNVNPKIYR